MAKGTLRRRDLYKPSCHVFLSQARNVITDVKKPETTLFFEQRRFRHLDAKPVGDDDRFVRAILERIRDLSGGQVLGPADDLP